MEQKSAYKIRSGIFSVGLIILAQGAWAQTQAKDAGSAAAGSTAAGASAASSLPDDSASSLEKILDRAEKNDGGGSAQAAAKSESTDKSEKDKAHKAIGKTEKSDKSDKDNSAPREDFDFLKALDYPELQVVPRASERLLLEAREERDGAWLSTWQYTVSGLSTLMISQMTKGQFREDISDSEKTQATQVTTIGQAIGAAWFVTGLGITLYKPYTSAYAKVQTLPRGKDRRSELLRERMAEEALERPAQLVHSLRWISSLTQLSTHLASYYYLKQDGRMYVGVGILTSLLPVLFDEYYMKVYQRHLDYKKKIYAPIATAISIPTEREVITLAQLTWTF